MRFQSWARWATCAIAISICVPAALAERPKKSLASCTSFDQNDKGEDKVEFTIKNTCSVPVDCSIRWRVVCAPSSKKRRAEHAGTTKLALAADNTMQSTEASAAVCGDDAWAIDSVHWTCEPNND